MVIQWLNHRKPTAVVFTVLFLVFLIDGNALQDKKVPPEYKLNKQFLESFVRDFGRVASSPKAWGKNDIIKLSALVATGTLIFIFDQDIHNWIQERRSSTSGDISRFVKPTGNGFFLGSSLTALYVTGEIIDDAKLRKIALLGLESWIITGVVVWSMKFLIGRARPHEEETSTAFHPFSFRSRYLSFPSGHASAAFAVATTIADHSEKFIVDALAYSLAFLVGISRVHDGKHWASDVFIGAAIGHLISKKISAAHRQEGIQKFQVDLQLTPQRQSFTISFIF